MNLAFINAAYQLGGAETVVQDLAAGCREAGHAARVYVAAGKTYPPGRRGVVPLYPRLLSRAYHTRLNALIERWAPRDKWTDLEFRRLGTGWPELVHVHNFHGDFATLESLAHVARLKPLVWTFHGHWGITGGCDHPLDCARYRDACGECPRLGVWPLGTVDDTAAQLQAKLDVLGGLPIDVIAPSRFLARNIERSRVGGRWRVHHIPNGVSLDAFRGARKADADRRRRLGLDPSRTTILVVNRSFRDPQKGFTTVRDAIMMLPAAGLSAQVVLAGEGSDWAASGLSAAVSPLSAGYVADRRLMADLFEVADILLFASPAENFPCVVLEAMASECTVVATPTSGVTEQIEDGCTGMLATDMSAAALARTLVTAVRDSALRGRLGKAARAHVRAHLTIEDVVERHLTLYRSLMPHSVQ